MFLREGEGVEKYIRIKKVRVRGGREGLGKLGKDFQSSCTYFGFCCFFIFANNTLKNLSLISLGLPLVLLFYLFIRIKKKDRGVSIPSLKILAENPGRIPIINHQSVKGN